MAQIDFTGNVGKDAELRFTPSGKPVLNFSVCDSKSRRTESGEWETLKEQWMNVALWGADAERYAGDILKGMRVRVFGEFYARQYEANDGTRGTSLDTTAHAVQIIPKRGEQQQRGQQGQAQGQGFGGQQGSPLAPNGGFADPWAQQGQPAAQQPAQGQQGAFGDEPPF